MIAGRPWVVFRHALLACACFALLSAEAYAQTNTLLYVPNQNDDNVSVYTTNANGTLTSAGTIAVGDFPNYTAIRGDQAFVYVTNSAGLPGNLNRSISVIDTNTQTVGQTVSVTAASSLFGVAVSPSGSTVYVAARATLTNTIRVFSADPATGQLTATTSINVGIGPRGIVLSRDGSRLYVVNQSVNTVSVIDTGTNTVVDTIPVGNQPLNIAISPDGTRLYVTNFTGGSVSVINTATNTVVATVPTGNGPNGVAVAPDGAHFYVAEQTDQTVAQFDTATNTAIAPPIASGQVTSGILISPDSTFLYATNSSNSDNVTMYTIAAGTGVLTANGSIASGNNPHFGAVCDNGNALLATGAIFRANTAGALGCAQPSPAFSGGTLLINNPALTITQSFALGTGGGTIDTNGNDATFSGVFSGAGALTKTGTGILTLSGANTYTGATTIAAGTVQAGAANVLGSNSAVDVSAGATLNLADFNQTVGTLTGQGTVSLGSATITTGSAGNPTFTGTINGTGGLTKTGSGFLFLHGNSTYTGPTTVSDGGGLILTGSIASSPVTIGFGASLHGTGTTGPLTVQAGGSIVPGVSGPGQLTTGVLTLMPSGSLNVVLSGSLPAQYDRVLVNGAATIGGILQVNTSSFTPTPGDTFTILSATGGVTGTFSGRPNNAVFSIGGAAFRVTYSPTSVVLTAVAVPTVTGAASGSVVFGGNISDTATIAGGFSPTGTITFSVYGPDNATCSGTPAFTDTRTVSGNGAYTSTAFTPSAAGAYRWIASYSGDTNNASTTGACNDAGQSVTVTKANQTIAFGTLTNRTLGDPPFTVSATASSGLGVTFTSQTPSICMVSADTVSTVGVGMCTLAADQAGNANYNAASTVTQSFSVAAGCSGIAIGPAQLLVGLVAIPYSQALTLTNGVTPVVLNLSGNLPPGLTFSNGVVSGTPTTRGAFPITVSGTDANGCQASASYSLAIASERRLVIGADAGGAATVRAFNIATGVPAAQFDALPNFTGGVSVAQGDVNGDGAPEIVTGAGAGGGPEVRVFGNDGALRLSFAAFDPVFRGGVEVAAGDINGDGVAEVLAVGGCAGPMEVRAFDGRTGAHLRTYALTPPSGTCGLHVAAGDVNGDGVADIVVGSGVLGAPFVQVVDGASGTTLRDVTAFDASFIGGVYVAAGDVTGDGLTDIIAGAAAGGMPRVRVFDGTTGSQITGALGDFEPYVAAFGGGVRVAAGDLNGDGRAEVITGAGPGGGPHVRVFDGATATEIYGLYALDPSFTGGVFVAGAPAVGRMAIDIAARTTANQIRIAGWALKEIAVSTSGTDAIHAWAYPVDGSAPIFIGAAPARYARPDVAGVFGGEFLMSGFDFAGTLTPGTYDLVVFARNVRTLRFDVARAVRVTVQ